MKFDKQVKIDVPGNILITIQTKNRGKIEKKLEENREKRLITNLKVEKIVKNFEKTLSPSSSSTLHFYILDYHTNVGEA